MAVLTVAASVAFPLLGMLPSPAILSFVLSAFVEKMPKVTSAVIAAASFAVLCLIFVTILSVQMPFGIFSSEFWGVP